MLDIKRLLLTTSSLIRYCCLWTPFTVSRLAVVEKKSRLTGYHDICTIAVAEMPSVKGRMIAATRCMYAEHIPIRESTNHWNSFILSSNLSESGNVQLAFTMDGAREALH